MQEQPRCMYASVLRHFYGLVISEPIFRQERHRHRYEFNNSFKEAYEAAGMKCVGINPESDLVEIVEIPALKWFVGTQFHPEYSSTVLHPHPLFVAFVKAAIENENEKK